MSESLRFEELQVRRAPGFEREGFTLSGLSGGINLIHGPNGAGKSTTARAVARLLWPGLPGGERTSLRGRFRLGEAEWGVDLDGSRVQYQREGAQANAPQLPAPEGHQRYLLSLHDLLREKDTGFAAVVARESAGGYDVRRSGAVLDPRPPLNRRNPLNEALERAREEYDDALARQQELRVRERELVELRQAFETAERARRRLTVLEAALEHARAREREAVARSELARFAEGMERVGGGEYEQLCRLRERVRKIEAEHRDAEKEAADARARVAAVALPEEALREELLRGLEEDLEQLERAERELERARRAHAGAMAKREVEGARIEGSVDVERLARVDLPTVTETAGLARRAGTIAARRDATDSQLRILAAEPVDGDAGQVQEGIRLLRCWLREPSAALPLDSGATGESRARQAAGVAAALLLVVLGALLAVTEHGAYVAASVLGLILLAVMLWPRSRPSPAADAREVHRREYGKLRLEEPEGWEASPVETLLGRLEERAVVLRQVEAQQQRRRELEGELRTIVEEERALESERARVAERLGVTAPETRPTELAWLAETLVRWQAAYAEVVAEEAAARAAEAELAGIAGALRARLETLGYPVLRTTGEIAGAVRDLRERRQTLQKERDRLAAAASALRRLEEERERQEREIARLFEGLGVEAGSDQTVREWCEQRAEYRRVHEAHRHAESVVANARERMEGVGAEMTLATAPSQELDAEIRSLQDEAARRDRLADDITATKTLIEEAKRSHGVEEALERVDRAREKLREARAKEVRSAIALELVNALERATRDQHLPAVFRRARELFARITHGRYELRLEREGEPEFTAFDQVDRQGRRLDELSSGTRVQLLLAVRVAFVEQQEQGVKLPLLLDEVLGNSDDERARAIMESAVELAREGRQVFYFTAQADEVARWRALAAEGVLEGVELREFDLYTVRRLQRQLEIPFRMPVARQQPVAPEGADHAEYGRRLAVPRLDRAEARAEEVHLWYLVERPETLHELLSLGPERWGQLRALLRNGGRPLVKAGLIAELEACGRIVEAFLEGARVGVGRRVDRGVLEESRAVTATFMDRVDDLARAVDGDGARLMEGLEAGEVPRFNQKSKDALREYLEANGYLPAAEPLGLREIRDQVVTRVAHDLAEGTLPMERVERLVGRLWVGVGGVE